MAGATGYFQGKDARLYYAATVTIASAGSPTWAELTATTGGIIKDANEVKGLQSVGAVSKEATSTGFFEWGKDQETTFKGTETRTPIEINFNYKFDDTVHQNLRGLALGTTVHFCAVAKTTDAKQTAIWFTGEVNSTTFEPPPSGEGSWFAATVTVNLTSDAKVVDQV